MYDPHSAPELAGEMAIMSKGRLIKARLPDQPAPNVSWFWIQMGNCLSCRHFSTGNEVRCLNPKIGNEDFLREYVYTNTCPGFEAGVEPSVLVRNPARADTLDVMKAAGIVSGEPGQQVKIIYNQPWSMDAAVRAHREQSTFMAMAMQSDRGGSNDSNRGEYVDMDDDLERPEAALEPEPSGADAT